MEGKKLENFKKKLLKQKNLLEEQIGIIEETGLNESMRDSISELSSYDNHSADISDVVFERSKDIALRDNARVLEDKVDIALERIKENEYGICANCGKKIPEERLEALPYATLCLECQNEFDDVTEKASPRPLEEGVFPHYFGDINNDNDPKGQTITDGEDIWQQLEYYGTANSPQDVPRAVKFDDIPKVGDQLIGAVEPVEKISQEEYEEAMEYENPKYSE